MVYPKYIYNHLFKRSVAYIIDLIIIDFITKPILWFMTPSGEFLSVYQMTKLLVYLAYFTLSTGLTNGHTLGKTIMGLRVIKNNGEDLDWASVLTRELVMGFVLYKWLIVAFITPFNEYRQSLGDMLSETGVVDESELEELEIKTDREIYLADQNQVTIDDLA